MTYVLIFIAVSFVYFIIYLIKRKADAGKFLKNNPDAAKVFLEGKIGLSSKQITLYTVNGAMPVFFRDGVKQGFYVPAGESVLEVDFTSSKIGILKGDEHETSAYGKQIVEAESGKSYSLGFNEEEGVYTFKEI
ncbi:hypothetical protein Dip518_001490 [Parelusimicrobium proximum]|uniref:hypothetical protein n=1 Tax=Parelusimicrobium proximum TaxID=3228953 RepID=UPI003D1736B1